MPDLDPATTASVRQKVRLATALIHSIPAEDLRAYIQELNHYETLAPVTDPTEWMDNADRTQETLQLLELMLDVREELAEIPLPPPEQFDLQEVEHG